MSYTSKICMFAVIPAEEKHATALIAIFRVF